MTTNVNTSFDIRRTPTSISAPLLLVAYSEFGVGSGSRGEKTSGKNRYQIHNTQVANKDARYEYSQGDRLGGDRDKDGFKGTDCSALVAKALNRSGYAIYGDRNQPNQPFATHAIFDNQKFTAFAKQNFDITTKKNDPELIKKNLQPGDILMFGPNKHGGQHIGIFSHYTPSGKPIFYDSYGGRGPGFSELDTILSPRVVGVLRPKAALYAPELDRTQKINTGLDCPSIKLAQGLGKSLNTLSSNENSYDNFEKHTQQILLALSKQRANYVNGQSPMINAIKDWQAMGDERKAVMLEIAREHPQLLNNNNFMTAMANSNWEKAGKIITDKANAIEAKAAHDPQHGSTLHERSAGLSLLANTLKTGHLPTSIIEKSHLNNHVHPEISNEKFHPSNNEGTRKNNPGLLHKSPLVTYGDQPKINPFAHSTFEKYAKNHGHIATQHQVNSIMMPKQQNTSLDNLPQRTTLYPLFPTIAQPKTQSVHNLYGTYNLKNYGAIQTPGQETSMLKTAQANVRHDTASATTDAPLAYQTTNSHAPTAPVDYAANINQIQQDSIARSTAANGSAHKTA